MDFAFYDEIGASTVLAPIRRAQRRLLRPTFYRLRDLLHLLFHRQEEGRALVGALRDELAQVRAQHAGLLARHTALAAEHAGHKAELGELRDECRTLRAQLARLHPVAVEAAGVGRRIATLEDALLRSLADRAAA